jgi:transposase
MIGSTRNIHVWAYTKPADLRKGYEGLYGLVTCQMKNDPLSGDCYLFTNRYRTRAKVLFWDGTGLCIFQKRLEKGRFACLWEKGSSGSLQLTISELSLFLEGSKLIGRVRLSPEEYVLMPFISR